jgi:hypothetical protein
MRVKIHQVVSEQKYNREFLWLRRAGRLWGCMLNRRDAVRAVEDGREKKEAGECGRLHRGGGS